MLAIACAMCLSVSASPMPDATTDMGAEYSDMTQTIKQLTKDSTALAKRVEQLMREVQKKQDQLAEMERKHQNTEAYISLKQLDDSILAREMAIEALNVLIQRQQDSLANHLATRDITARIESKQATDKGLKDFADGIRNRLVPKAEALTRQKYSAMDIDTIRAVIAEMDLYASDPAMQGPRAQLDKARQIKEQYDAAVAVLQAPCNPAAVSKAVRTLKGLESNVLASKPGAPKPWTEVQWAEISEDITALEAYGPAVEAFASLFANVKEIRAPYNRYSVDLCEDEIKAEVQQFESAQGEALTKLPYMQKRYADYKTAILKNAYDGDEIAAEILSSKQ